MEVRYTDFFTHGKQEYAVFIEGNVAGLDQYEFKVLVKSGDQNATIRCKNINNILEILPPNRPEWVKQVEGVLVKILEKKTFTNSPQLKNKAGKSSRYL